MSFSNRYPYTDFHELNLDWFLQEFNTLVHKWEDLAASNEEFKQTMTERFGTLSNTVETFTRFVTNYFNNLDVQEEINHKLDEMAADGTLDALLLPYFNAYKAEINGIVTKQNTKIATLKSRMDEFASLPDGSTAGDAELLDIRIGVDGYTYASAGDAVRGQISDTDVHISNIANEQDKSYSLSYEQGTIALDGAYSGTLASSDKVIRTKYVLSPGKYYVNTNDQEIAIALYDNNTTFTSATYVEELGSRWVSGSHLNYTVPSGRYAKILVRKNATDDITPVENTTAWKSEYKISNDVKDLKGIVYTKDYTKLDLNYEQGLIALDGQYAGTKGNSDYYIRSSILLSPGKYHIEGNGQEFTVCAYNSQTIQSNLTYVGIIGTRWLSTYNAIIPDGQYALILVKNKDTSEITPADCVVRTDKYVELLQEINKIKVKADTAIQDGYYSPICQSTEFISRMGVIESTSDEDTLTGIKKARKYGFSHIRHSLSFTSDSVPVLAHNATIEIGGVTYTIAETPYATLEGHITTLEDAIILNKRLGMKVDLELKYGTSNSNIDIAYTIVAAAGMEHVTLWTSDNRSYLSYLLEKQRDIKIGYIASCSTTNIDRAYAMKNEYNYVRLDCFNTDVSPEYPDDYSDSTLAYAAEKGIPIKLGSAWTTENMKKWASMLQVVEVAYIKYPYKVMLDSYLDI